MSELNHEIAPRRRLHRFTYAVLAAATCAITLMIVPGQVGTSDSCLGDSWNKYEHGWPWIYLERWKGFQFGRETALPVDAVPWCHSFCWRFFDHSEQVGPTAFRPWVLAADAMCGLAVVVAAGAVAQWWRRRRSRILQLSMKDLLACVLVLSSALAWWRWQQDQYGEALRVANELQEKGIRSEMEYVGPAWAARLLGTGSLNICRRPVAVTLSGDAERLTHELKHHHDILSYLNHVDIQDARLSPAAIDDLAQFSHCASLRWYLWSLMIAHSTKLRRWQNCGS